MLPTKFCLCTYNYQGKVLYFASLYIYFISGINNTLIIFLIRLLRHFPKLNLKSKLWIRSPFISRLARGVFAILIQAHCCERFESGRAIKQRRQQWMLVKETRATKNSLSTFFTIFCLYFYCLLWDGSGRPVVLYKRVRAVLRRH